MESSSDTIFALASGAGRAAIAVVRISGPATRAALAALASPLPEPRRLVLRTFATPEGEALDQGMAVFMPGPSSYTGEDQAELHLHGSRATVAAALRALGAMPGCRPAAPGEFTRRAFLNGRLDLSRVEGLADLIDAETEAQRRQALRQLEGALGSAVEAWREESLTALALIEAALDFSDEGDVPESLEDEAQGRLSRVREEMAGLLAQRSGERLRDGFTVVIAGPPNAGKSTLLNAIARRDVAIVSPIPGTTRDAIEVRCDLDGLPVTFVDTAGLRDTADPVELEGVTRARRRAEAADLVLWLVPPDGAAHAMQRGQILRIGTKADLAPPPPDCLPVSALTGAGLDALLATIAAEARDGLGAGDALLTRERHRTALARAEAAFLRAVDLLANRGPIELAAEEARHGLHALGEITGRVDVEDVLDRLFSAFCIGK